jgi:hypothetical protein
MTQVEIKEILSKQINQLEMLISAAKQRGDLKAAIQLSTELTEARDAFNAIT